MAGSRVASGRCNGEPVGAMWQVVGAIGSGRPTGTSQTYVSIGAKDTSATLKLKNEDGKERLLVP